MNGNPYEYNGITRDFLAEHGEVVYQHINDEKYKYDGKIYTCGWQSPRASAGIEEGGWVVMEEIDSLITQWQWQLEHSSYLWEHVARHILNILKTQPPETALAIFVQSAKDTEKMAVTGYYERAAAEVREIVALL